MYRMWRFIWLPCSFICCTHKIEGERTELGPITPNGVSIRINLSNVIASNSSHGKCDARIFYDYEVDGNAIGTLVYAKELPCPPASAFGYLYYDPRLPGIIFDCPLPIACYVLL